MEENCVNCEHQKKIITEKMNPILEKYTNNKNELIQILNEVQETFGYIPKEAMLQISEKLDIAMAEVYGVVTFYSRFTLKPKGKYALSICLGTACFVKGAEKLLDRAKQRLSIDEGQTTADGKFSIDTTRCVGACGLAPVFTINDEVYGRASVKKIDEVLDEYLKKE